MRQRVVIAMALLCKPKLIIADEPTTALDVTIQTEIIRLLKEIHKAEKTSIVLITHDLPVVAGLCERIMVMYAGRIVESGTIDDIFHHARHPYTQALLAATPQNISKKGRMKSIDGQPPDPLNLPTGVRLIRVVRLLNQSVLKNSPRKHRLIRITSSVVSWESPNEDTPPLFEHKWAQCYLQSRYKAWQKQRIPCLEECIIYNGA